MQQGWEAAMSGTPIDDYARSRPELAAAIQKFGKRN
jgi:ribulose 1,5-bisphosphate carboxylase large subunit-like protein